MATSERASFEEQQLFQLLCLLDVPEAATKHGVELAPTCFRKPNAKGLELVLFRLYATIHGEAKAAKDFRDVWPVVDRNQSKEFNQHISDWFKELKEKYQLDTLSSMTASQLKSASGHRIVSTLLELATLGAQMSLARLAPSEAAAFQLRTPAEKDVRLFPLVEHAVRDMAALAVSQQAEAFIRLTRSAGDAQEALEKDAAALKDQFYAVKLSAQRLGSGTSALGEQTSDMWLQTPEDDGLWRALIDAATRGGSSAAALDSAVPLAGDWELADGVAGLLAPLAGLDAHLEEYPRVGQLLQAVVGSGAHPHAVDGAVLRSLRAAAVAAAGGSAADRDAASSNDSAVVSTAVGGPGGLGCDGCATEDVVEIMDAWVSGLETVSETVERLVASAGPPGSNAGAGAGGPGPHPLLASASDSAGHAALLATQLRAHRELEGRLQDLVVALRARILEVDTGLREVLPRVQEGVQRMQEAQASALRTAEGRSRRSSRHGPPTTPPAPAAHARTSVALTSTAQLLSTLKRSPHAAGRPRANGGRSPAPPLAAPSGHTYVARTGQAGMRASIESPAPRGQATIHGGHTPSFGARADGRLDSDGEGRDAHLHISDQDCAASHGGRDAAVAAGLPVQQAGLGMAEVQGAAAGNRPMEALRQSLELAEQIQRAANTPGLSPPPLRGSMGSSGAPRNDAAITHAPPPGGKSQRDIDPPAGFGGAPLGWGDALDGLLDLDGDLADEDDLLACLPPRMPG